LDNSNIEKKRFLNALLFPAAFTLLLWIVKITEVLSGISFSGFGIYPLEINGLKGIIFSSLIHGSWEHLINNTPPVFVLSLALFYFYRPISYKVFFLIYFLHGFWLWFFARESYHIGASGLVYGMGSFLFISGLIRKNSHLLAISLIVAFLYGSMVWGIFPIREAVSWEGHLTGMAAGIILSVYYKNYGPSANIGRWKYDMPEEETTEGEPDDENDYWNYPPEEEDKRL
jgi:membrane associated rhomboid family serine protease